MPNGREKVPWDELVKQCLISGESIVVDPVEDYFMDAGQFRRACYRQARNREIQVKTSWAENGRVRVQFFWDGS